MIQRFPVSVHLLLFRENKILLMQRCNPQWSEEQTHTYAQILLWLIDCYSRSDLQGMKNLPSADFLLEFFRRGAGLM